MANNKPRVVFPKYLDRNDFNMSITDTDIACGVGKWVEIGSYQVGSQKEVAFGVGKVSDNGVDSRRIATIRIDGATGQITTGKMRLAYSDANGVSVQPVQEELLTVWDDGTVKVAEVTGLRAREDSYLKLLVNLTTASTVDMSNTDINISIPVTEYIY